MNSQGHASGFSRLQIAQQALASLLALVLLFATCPQRLVAQDQQDPQAQAGPPYMQQVYQKDLGKKTEALGTAMQEYNPDSSWSKAEEEPAQPASGQKP